jgi:hypothetical protein
MGHLLEQGFFWEGSNKCVRDMKDVPLKHIKLIYERGRKMAAVKPAIVNNGLEDK